MCVRCAVCSVYCHRWPNQFISTEICDVSFLSHHPLLYFDACACAHSNTHCTRNRFPWMLKLCYMPCHTANPIPFLKQTFLFSTGPMLRLSCFIRIGHCLWSCLLRLMFLSSSRSMLLLCVCVRFFISHSSYSFTIKSIDCYQ